MSKWCMMLWLLIRMLVSLNPDLPSVVCMLTWFLLCHISATDLILSRARSLEKHVHTQLPPPEGTNAYRTKMRSLFLNLKAANNPALREDVVSGEISVARLYGMTPAVSFTFFLGFFFRFPARAQSSHMVALFRKWHRKNNKLLIVSWSRKICSKRRVRRLNRQRQTDSNVVNASSDVLCITR